VRKDLGTFAEKNKVNFLGMQKGAGFSQKSDRGKNGRH
jgi:hypothetical protein